jgi:uncharacterized integral membrane protein (TIGR00697 family)
MQCKSIDKAYTPLVWLAVIYVAAMILADVLTYNVMPIFGVLVSTSLFVFPLTFSVGDITAESYGRRIALTLVIACLVGDFLVDSSLSLSTHYLSSADTHSFDSAYKTILYPLFQVFEGNFIGVLAGSIVNVLLMVRLKRFYQFRHFIPRSICSTFLGEITYTAIAYSIWFYNKGSADEILGMVAMSMGFKIIFAAIVSIPSCYIAAAIKKIKFNAGLTTTLDSNEVSSLASQSSFKVDEIGSISTTPGLTKYKILIQSKNIAFTMTAKDVLEKHKNLSSFSKEDQALLLADLNGDLFKYLNEKYEI